MKFLTLMTFTLLTFNVFSHGHLEKITKKDHPGEYLAIENSLTTEMNSQEMELKRIKKIEFSESTKKFRAFVSHASGKCIISGSIYEIFVDSYNEDSEVIGYTGDEASIEDIDCN